MRGDQRGHGVRVVRLDRDEHNACAIEARPGFRHHFERARFHRYIEPVQIGDPRAVPLESQGQALPRQQGDVSSRFRQQDARIAADASCARDNDGARL